jgi:hypothetical protein
MSTSAGWESIIEAVAEHKLANTYAVIQIFDCHAQQIV